MTTISRRSFLAASGVGTLGVVTGLGTSITLAAPGVPNDGDVLVVLFLRGGMDGLSLTPPITDPAYYDLRPTIAIPQPGERHGALRLDSATNSRARFSSGFDGAFGLHPGVKSLHDGLWADGKLAFVPGSGLPGSRFSHFSSTLYHARGTTSSSVGGGWLGRMSNVQGGPGPIPVVNGPTAANLLSGNTDKLALIDALDSFELNGFADSEIARQALLSAYGSNDSLSVQARSVLNSLDRIAPLDDEIRPGYGTDRCGRMFSDLAKLLEAEPHLGIRSVSLAATGWDMHRNLGTPNDTSGNFYTKIKEVSDAISTFAADTNGLDGITLIVTSEFGRTTNENGNGGTDHGVATTMMFAGAGVKGGVYGDDFADSLALNGKRRGAPPIMTDFRKPVSELITKRARVADTKAVFPDYVQEGSALGLA